MASKLHSFLDYKANVYWRVTLIASAVYAVVVCPSVISQCSSETVNHRIMQTTPCDSHSQGTLMPMDSTKFELGHRGY